MLASRTARLNFSAAARKKTIDNFFSIIQKSAYLTRHTLFCKYFIGKLIGAPIASFNYIFFMKVMTYPS